MPKVTAEHVEARRTQIICAAYKCFGEKGFHKTTIREICREAGLSAGAVYGYFKSKLDILLALEEMGQRQTRGLLEDSDPGGAAPRALEAMLGRAIELLGSDEARESARFSVRLWGETLQMSEVEHLCPAALSSLRAPFAEAVRRGQRRGEIGGEIDAEAAARVFAAICVGFQVLKAMEPDDDFAGCTDVVAAMLDGSFPRGGKEK